MEDTKFRQNLASYIEKTDFGIQSQKKIITSLKIDSYSKSQNAAKMLIRFVVQPDWLNEQQLIPPGLLISLFDVSSTVLAFYFDPRFSASTSIKSSILSSASLNDELQFFMTLHKFPHNIFNITSAIKCKGKTIAKSQHTKLLINNTSWIPKL